MLTEIQIHLSCYDTQKTKLLYTQLSEPVPMPLGSLIRAGCLEIPIAKCIIQPCPVQYIFILGTHIFEKESDLNLFLQQTNALGWRTK